MPKRQKIICSASEFIVRESIRLFIEPQAMGIFYDGCIYTWPARQNGTWTDKSMYFYRHNGSYRPKADL